MNSVNGRSGCGPSFGNVRLMLSGAKKANLGPVRYLNCMDHLAGTIGKLNENPLVQKRDLFIGGAEKAKNAKTKNDLVLYEKNGKDLKEVLRVSPGADGEATPNTTMNAINTLAEGILKFVGAKK